MDRVVNNSSSEADCNSDRFCSQFNSTALTSLEESLDPCTSNLNKKPDLKLSPILNDSSDRRTVFSRRMIQYKYRGESPLVKRGNTEALHSLGDISEIRCEKEDSSTVYSSSSNQTFETSHANKENAPGTSTPEREANSKTHTFSRSTNSFESRILETLHTNTFSPSVFAITGTPPSPEEFKWSIEELSMLKPVHISQEEIAQSAYSPDPEHEAKIQSILDEYWRNNTCHIPSPDVPPMKNPLLMSAPETPLCDMVRISAAARMKYSTSSPKSRPNLGNVSRRNSIVQSYRSRQSQTEITIAPSVDFDFAQVLGPSCIYNPSEDGEDSVFNASSSSVGSLRRRLFTDGDEAAPNCGSPTNLAEGDHSLDSSSSQNVIQYDVDGCGNSFSGFDVDLSPIKNSPPS